MCVSTGQLPVNIDRGLVCGQSTPHCIVLPTPNRIHPRRPFVCLFACVCVCVHAREYMRSDNVKRTYTCVHIPGLNI